MVDLFLEAARTVAVMLPSVQGMEIVGMLEVEPVASVGVGVIVGVGVTAGAAATAGAAGTAGVAEVKVVGSVEVEACGNQLLNAVAGEVAHSQVSVEHFVAPAQFSGVGLLLLCADEPLPLKKQNEKQQHYDHKQYVINSIQSIITLKKC